MLPRGGRVMEAMPWTARPSTATPPPASTAPARPRRARRRGGGRRRSVRSGPSRGSAAAARRAPPGGPRRRLRRGLGRLVGVLHQQRAKGGRGEHLLPRERVPEHRAEPVHVAPRVHRVAPRLLGGHERGRPQQRVVGRELARVVVGIDHLRDAEIEHLHELGVAVLLEDEDVLGLEVAVDHPGVVGLAERPRRLRHHRDRAPRGERPLALDQRGEGLAFEELHHVVPEAVGGAAVVEHAHGVGVAQEGHRAHLTFEAGDGDPRLAAGLEHLDGDGLLERAVPGEPHLAHRAGADHALELVAPHLARLRHLPPERPHDVAADDEEGGGREDPEGVLGEDRQGPRVVALGAQRAREREGEEREGVDHRDGADAERAAAPGLGQGDAAGHEDARAPRGRRGSRGRGSAAP